MGPLNIITSVSTVVGNLRWLSEAAVEPLRPGAFRLSPFFHETGANKRNSARIRASVYLGVTPQGIHFRPCGLIYDAAEQSPSRGSSARRGRRANSQASAEVNKSKITR